MKQVKVLIFSILLVFSISSSSQNKPKEKQEKAKVIFMELGSVRCIPCQKMQKVMTSVEEKFGSQVKVVFYDVWTPEGKPYGKKYNINSIPTQIFFDKNGKEYYRHVGYFPEDELVKILKQKGVK